jgi:hypothetical protein
MRQVLESRRVAAVYGHYVAARGNRRMARRRDIDPASIRQQLPYLYIVQVERSGGELHFRFRLMGTELVHVFKREGTGGYVRELELGGWEVEWRNSLVYAVETKVPVVAVDKIKLSNGRELEVEHLALPLSDDEVTVDRVIGAIDFLVLPESELKDVLAKLDWSATKHVDVPKRLMITNLALPLD